MLLWLPQGGQAQAERCTYQNPDAWHDPECGMSWVVRDSHRTTSVRIEHTPSYHTYSIWTIGGQQYVLAYRDQDSDPSDIVVDFYRMDGSHYVALGTELLAAVPSEVRLVKLIPDTLPQLAFFARCGQLQCLTVVRFDGDHIEELLDYAASEIRIHDGAQPFIEAVSKTAKIVEKVEWDPKRKKFRAAVKSIAKD
jgi:hypothetical protein